MTSPDSPSCVLIFLGGMNPDTQEVTREGVKISVRHKTESKLHI